MPRSGADQRSLRLWHVWIVLPAAFATAIAVAVGAFFAGWDLLGAQSLKPEHQLTSSTLFELVKLSLGVVAGAGALVALVVAYRRQRVDEDGALREATRLHTERFTTSVSQLGEESAAVRLGGVHALAGLADDAPTRALRQTCIDVLCAYLRLPYTAQDDLPTDDAAARHAYLALREVRHTVIRLLRDHLRLPAGHPHSWQGHDLDFTNVVFDGGDFSRAMFSGGSVTFDGAEFSGGWVAFNHAVFSDGTVTFNHAVFSDGTVTFDNAEFCGGTVSFGDAEVSDGTVTFCDAKFSGGAVAFFGAGFLGGTVAFARSVFSGGTVTFVATRFFGGAVSFADTEFSGSRVSFAHAEFSGGTVSFDNAEFSGGRVSFDDAEVCDGMVSFFSARFSGGRVTFAQALFRGGTVSFDDADVSQGTVTFNHPGFSGGTVRFSDAHGAAPSGLVPPPGQAPPPGLSLPAAWLPNTP
ncbi:pentapeptide repeat-containing protein [Streptomyces sp. NPDC048248]|uniref:pentapeptide repeat-containing protein n=1 Tax=Streptomyces sp. NPDC048248 TaxID=3365523 RepID=UPI0037158AD5